ncbi:hypothetical protein PVT71_12385 [Salipiger sp. H15]|uniref:Uncharacterized protein n=1 Tax=Alloyangia sp. H15 TaxID=3029062 RepID=A0AAU8AEK1_9RHOB
MDEEFHQTIARRAAERAAERENKARSERENAARRAVLKGAFAVLKERYDPDVKRYGLTLDLELNRGDFHIPLRDGERLFGQGDVVWALLNRIERPDKRGLLWQLPVVAAEGVKDHAESVFNSVGGGLAVFHTNGRGDVVSEYHGASDDDLLLGLTPREVLDLLDGWVRDWLKSEDVLAHIDRVLAHKEERVRRVI